MTFVPVVKVMCIFSFRYKASFVLPIDRAKLVSPLPINRVF